MKSLVWKKLKALKTWQLALLLVFGGFAAALAISQTIRMLAALNSAISAVGALVLVVWVYVAISRGRENDEWIG